LVAEHGGAPGMTDAETDALRIGALSVLVAMQAPEAEDLLRQKILDAEYLSREQSYTTLLHAAGQTGIDNGTLRQDMRANNALIADGPGNAHQIVGIQRQVLYLQRHDNPPLAPALDPVFDLLERGAVYPSVHNAAARALQQTPARIAERDAEYFIDRTTALLWSGSTPERAGLPLSLLTALMRTPGFVDLVVEAVADQIDPHLESWVVNPASAVVMFSGTLRGLDHNPVRETAGAVMGKAIASPALDMDYLGAQFARGGGALATLDHNTVEGVIAVFSPTIFALVKPAAYPFPMASFAAA